MTTTTVPIIQHLTSSQTHILFSGLTANVFSSYCYLLMVVLCTSSTSANKALEEKVQDMNGATDKSVAELKERIQVLEKELDNANELLSSSKLRGLLE